MDTNSLELLRLAAGKGDRPRVASIEAIAVSLPMRRPMKMAGIEIRTADNLLVRVTGDDDRIGWGEAASAPTMTGELLAGMAAAVDYLRPHIVGERVVDFARGSARLDSLLYGNVAAKAAINMAMLDLLGKAMGVPVHALLGVRRRERLAAMWLLGTGSAEGDIDEAIMKKRHGFVAFKIKVGVGDPLSDARRTRDIRSAIGAGPLVCADANQGWNLEQALAYVAAIRGVPIDFLEQPVASGDLVEMRTLSDAGSVPIGSDEGIHCLDDIRRHHAAGAAVGCSLKTIKLGGLTAVMEAAQLCDKLGMKINLACKVAESSIATAAVLQLGTVLPALDWGVSLSSQYLADDIVATPPAVVDGHVRVPDGPGLGVDVDLGKVDRYRISSSGRSRSGP